jgi:arginyl-tRNA--protein-N-Asp/Glu arginylyltransferase
VNREKKRLLKTWERLNKRAEELTNESDYSKSFMKYHEVRKEIDKIERIIWNDYDMTVPMILVALEEI